MITSDSIYRKPYKPKIEVLETDGAGALYTYDPWTDVGTSGKPLQLEINLSQNHFGNFSFAIDAENYTIPFSAGDRVRLTCGKQSSQMTMVMQGLIRNETRLRGADRKNIAIFEGAGLGIRFNELILYHVSEAARLSTGQLNMADATRKADTLLESILSGYFGSGDDILSSVNLAANSDVENFIAQLSIEFGEYQDMINNIEEQSGGEVVVAVDGDITFRNEIRGPVGGRGFTVKNKPANLDITSHDADDTMYLIGKNWDINKSFYKDDNYANWLFGILSADDAEPEPINRIIGNFLRNSQEEVALKFRPTHSHWLPGDIYVFCTCTYATGTDPIGARFRVCRDSGGIPMNAGGVIANIEFPGSAFQQSSTLGSAGISWSNEQAFLNTSGGQIEYFDLDTTQDYWLILSDMYTVPPNLSPAILWNRAASFNTGPQMTSTSKNSTDSAGGSGWGSSTTSLTVQARFPIRRSHSFTMYDPKGIKYCQSGFANGLPIQTVLPDASPTIKSREGLYRYMAQQLYLMSRPRRQANIPIVTAPNIPPLPGDMIFLNDSVLGYGTPDNQVVQMINGDMRYAWDFSASVKGPTKLSLNPVGILTGYK